MARSRFIPDPTVQLADQSLTRAYTSAMRSSADDLRQRTREQVLAFSASARIAIALSLGDDDLALFMGVSRMPRDLALRHVRAQRSRGRLPSAAAAR
jgi:hypothetical protein